MNQSSPPNKPSQAKRLTVRDVLTKSEEWLSAKNVDSPRLSSQLVVSMALGLDRLRLFMDMDRPLSEAELAAIRPLLARRGAGEPMAYILGEKEFYGLDFRVTPAVLIPRPETEMLVEEALKRFSPPRPRSESSFEDGDAGLEASAGRETEEQGSVSADDGNGRSGPSGEPGLSEELSSETEQLGGEQATAPRRQDMAGDDLPVPSHGDSLVSPSCPEQDSCQDEAWIPRLVRLADFGCGSGILAVTMAKLLPNAQAVALDLSHDALEVAKSNAERQGVADRVLFAQADFGAAPLATESLDLALANPPYLSDAELAQVSREVADFEPHMALTSGPEGCECVRRVIEEAGRALKPGGLILMEIGYAQGEQAADLFAASSGNWAEVKVHKDLSGLDRMIVAIKGGSSLDEAAGSGPKLC